MDGICPDIRIRQGESEFLCLRNRPCGKTLHRCGHRAVFHRYSVGYEKILLVRFESVYDNIVLLSLQKLLSQVVRQRDTGLESARAQNHGNRIVNFRVARLTVLGTVQQSRIITGIGIRRHHAINDGFLRRTRYGQLERAVLSGSIESESLHFRIHALLGYRSCGHIEYLAGGKVGYRDILLRDRHLDTARKNRIGRRDLRKVVQPDIRHLGRIGGNHAEDHRIHIGRDILQSHRRDCRLIVRLFRLLIILGT